MTRLRLQRTAATSGAETVARSNSIPLDQSERVPLAEGIMGRYGLCPANLLIENPNAVKTHSKRQIRKIARAMKLSGPLSPIVIDESYIILAGHARLAAAKEQGAEAVVPVVLVEGLTEAQKRLYLLGDNRLGDDGGLDRKKLAKQLPELQALFAEANFELIDSGFEVAEFDEFVLDMDGEHSGEEEKLDAELFDEPCFLNVSDLLQLGNHRLFVGDARDSVALDAVMQGELADGAFLDPPYNVSARSIGGRGRNRHPEFAFAFGEMDRPQYVSFLNSSFKSVADRCRPGAIVFACNDSHHVRDMLDAADVPFSKFLTLVVWNKTNAGQGGLYRNQHELIGVFRVGDEPHLDNVQMGRFGRNRSNVWTYAGVNTFRAGRMEDLACHPTVKPTRLVAEALKDVTKQGDIVLDTFVGSGTTILAAEKTGRCARALEINPRYAQAAARRWEKMTGRDAIQVASGLTLDELAERRGPVLCDASSVPQQETASSATTRPRVRTRTSA